MRARASRSRAVVGAALELVHHHALEDVRLVVDVMEDVAPKHIQCGAATRNPPMHIHNLHQVVSSAHPYQRDTSVDLPICECDDRECYI